MTDDPNAQKSSARSPPGDEPDQDAELGPEDDAMKALIKRSLAGPPPTAAKREESILRGVQKRIRKRSRGRFFADGWSTSDPRVSTVLIALAMLAVLLICYLILGPVGIQ